MFRRSLSKRHSSLIFSLWRIRSYSSLTASLLFGALFIVPTAQAASCKIPKSYYKNVSCTSNSGYFLAIKDFGAPVSLLNNKGKSVVDLSRYQKVDANNLSGNLLPVQRNNRVGYLNMQGREVVPAMYDVLTEGQGWARPVSDGRIVVKKDGNYGVINTANKIIVPFSASISDIDDYQNGRARVRKNQAVSWLDKNGKTISEPSNENKEQASPRSSNTSANSSSPKQTASNRFTTLQPRKQDGKWGYIDDNEVVMITYSFDDARPFSEGLAGVRIGKDWGFINLGGELVIPFRFANSGVSAGDRYKGQPAFVFTGGKAWIGNLKNGNKMCVDKEGTGVRCD